MRPIQRLLTVFCLAQITFVSAYGEGKQIYPRYESVFQQKTHVDGTPLLAETGVLQVIRERIQFLGKPTEL